MHATTTPGPRTTAPELRSWQEIYTQHLGQWSYLLAAAELNWLPAEYTRIRMSYAVETGMKLMVCEALGL